VGIPIENDGVDLKAFEEALKHQAPRLFYAIADFQNPSGATTSAAKRERLVELTRQHGFWIVEDAPYRDLRYYGEPAPTMLSMAPDRVLQLSSFSKLLSPGIRTGYVVGPAEVVAKMTKVAEDTFITPVLPTQGIVYEYLRRGHLDQNLPRLRDLFRARLDATLASLARELPEATWMQPQGGYFVGVSLPGHIPSDVLLKRAAEAGLTLTDGDGFFPEKPTGTFVRIPFCGITPPEIQEGVARLAQVYRALR
jgi:2-aminoadipate transaminase